MVIRSSILRVADNTGIKKANFIRVLKGQSFVGGLGDIILFSIRKVKKKKSYIKKKLYFGLIINIKKKTKRLDGTYISFKLNTVLTLNENFKFIGTKIHFPVCLEVLKKKKKLQNFKRIMTYTKSML